MAKILLHCPLNISRSLVQMLEEFCSELGTKYKKEIIVETQPHRREEKSLMESYSSGNNHPEMTIGHIDDFADFSADYMKKNFISLKNRFPLSKDLDNAGFSDKNGYFHTFGVIPFAVFFNKNMIDEKDCPTSWEDLLDKKFENKIIMPDEFRIVSLVIKTFLELDFPKKFTNFESNFTLKGSPMEVVTAVDEGRFPIGITNMAFARISRHKNTQIIWPEDGLFCMPQAMVFSKNAEEFMFEIGDYLLSKEVQEFLSIQTFVPAAPDIPMHELLANNKWSLKWKGFEPFMEAMKKRHGKKGV